MAARTKVDFSRLLLSIIICLLEHNTQYHWAICLHIWCCYLLWSGSPIMKDSLVLLLPCSESWLVMKDVVSVWFSSIFGVKDWELCVSIDSPLPLLILEFNCYKVILIETRRESTVSSKNLGWLDLSSTWKTQTSPKDSSWIKSRSPHDVEIRWDLSQG